MESSRDYICDSCKKKFPFEGVRYSKDGKRILCIECLDKVMKADKSASVIKKKPQQSQQLRGPVNLPVKVQAKKKEDIKLRCTKCKYRFVIKKDSRIRAVCPYCGGDQLSEEADSSAERLLEDVSEIRDRYD